VAIALAIAAPWCFHCGSIDTRELVCEEAAAHLVDCCPGFTASVLRCSQGQDCSGVRPDISEPESACIREMSCASLRAPAAAGSVCERSRAKFPKDAGAGNQPPFISLGPTNGDEAVCP